MEDDVIDIDAQGNVFIKRVEFTREKGNYVAYYKEPHYMKNEDGSQCTLMEYLDSTRIILTKKLENGNIQLTEGCDKYYKIEVTPAVLRLFISHLQGLLGNTV